ncbi:MAG: hypothetical protein DYG90_00475 [Chloroflexi bacterium CFX6]|nr:hypothetical protein [Chloroflexi bacterium CFX6]
MKNSPEYQAWRSMINRCERPQTREYANYGARGITVCPRWRSSFVAFYADMGPRPTPTHSLDRIDNDGNYEPDNCRWSTIRDQARNKRSNHRIAYSGEDLTVTEWAERTGIKDYTILRRLQKGWTPEAALTTRNQRPGSPAKADRS